MLSAWPKYGRGADMASAPQWKIFNPAGEYVAATKFAEDAAAVVGLYGDGAQIRLGHAKRYTVWTDGVDGSAGDSYDACAEVLIRRKEELRREVEARQAARWKSNTDEG